MKVVENRQFTKTVGLWYTYSKEVHYFMRTFFIHHHR